MVRLDGGVLRYMSPEEFRVLTAVEMGMKNHEIVPTTLIQRISKLNGNLTFKTISLLHKNKMIVHENKQYDGYKLTYLGYDYLALKTFLNRGLISGLGRRIGVGKESDIYEVINDKDEIMILKVHRLGRISFRTIKSKRDYLQNRTHASWLYMARLAALREYVYLKALEEHNFPVPKGYDQNRHCILMSRVDGKPFSQFRALKDPNTVYSTLMNLIVKLAEHGLIHCDFNEFNLMVNEDTEEVTLIDFPQMVSTSHENADFYFARDVQCVRTYFNKRFKMQTDEYPVFSEDSGDKQLALDTYVNASGASKKLTKEETKQFEEFLAQEAAERILQGDDGNGDYGSDEDEDQPELVEEGSEEAAAAALDGKQALEQGEDQQEEEDDEEVDPKKKLREQRKLERRLAKYKAMDAKGKGKVNKFSETHAEELEELEADQASRASSSTSRPGQEAQEVVLGEDGEPVLDVDRIRRRVHRSYETKKQRGYQKGRKAQNRVKNRTKRAHHDQIKMDM